MDLGPRSRAGALADGEVAPIPSLSALVKGFRMPAGHGVREGTKAGVRKASREETAGEFAPAVLSDYGVLVVVFNVIF
jgi:hypothetical protein